MNPVRKSSVMLATSLGLAMATLAVAPAQAQAPIGFFTNFNVTHEEVKHIGVNRLQYEIYANPSDKEGFWGHSPTDDPREARPPLGASHVRLHFDIIFREKQIPIEAMYWGKGPNFPLDDSHRLEKDSDGRWMIPHYPLVGAAEMRMIYLCGLYKGKRGYTRVNLIVQITIGGKTKTVTLTEAFGFKVVRIVGMPPPGKIDIFWLAEQLQNVVGAGGSPLVFLPSRPAPGQESTGGNNGTNGQSGMSTPSAPPAPPSMPSNTRQLILEARRPTWVRVRWYHQSDDPEKTRLEKPFYLDGTSKPILRPEGYDRFDVEEAPLQEAGATPTDDTTWYKVRNRGTEDPFPAPKGTLTLTIENAR